MLRTAVLLVVLLASVACLPSGDELGSDAAARIGETVRAGDFNLTVPRLDPSFNPRPYNDFTKANIAVLLRVTNAHGDAKKAAELLPLAFRLADRQGVIYGTDLNCTRCPGELQPAAVQRDATVEGTLYFALPEGRELVELRYEPPATGAKARIALR